MEHASPTNPAAPAASVGARAEVLRTELESSGLGVSTTDEVIRLIEESSRALADLEERLAVAESSLASSDQRLAEEIERQDSLRYQLIRQEKLASLGALVARIAHEMRNHLNFVNNFAEIMLSLAGELADVVRPQFPKLPDGIAGEVEDLLADIDETAKKIHSHGQTSVNIMASMLEHSRGGQAEFSPADLNALVDESLRLAYHGVRAQYPGFDVAYSADLDHQLVPIVVAGQDISRVLLNVLSNAFDAVRQRAEQNVENYRPQVTVTTRLVDDTLEIIVRDNGVGIDKALLEQVMTPFFTTKPEGHGTGLGLSISYDIVTGEHGGRFSIESEQGVGTSVHIVLPTSRDH